jgi:tRNA (guanine37-N1)-methyltransferase
MQEKKFDVEENHKVDLTYENFTSYEILKASLPKGIDIPTGFETVGDIAHMNLFKD